MISEEILALQESMLQDIARLVEVASYRRVGTPQEPFGEGVAQAFRVFQNIAEEKGFLVESVDGYAIHASDDLSHKPYIGILAHLDVVEAGDPTLWRHDPYTMVEEDGVLYGRGVNDDKGPLIAALYAMWLIKKQGIPLEYPIRLIAGGAEETTWECMKHYFHKYQQPLYGFSPDGNFPIVNGEKGILQVAIQFPGCDELRIQSKRRLDYVCDELRVEGAMERVYHGELALSRNPQRGKNAIYAFVHDVQHTSLPNEIQPMIDLIKTAFLDDDFGEKSGLYAKDEDMGTTSVCPMSLTCNQELIELCIDIRYVRTTSKEKLLNQLHKLIEPYGATLQIIKEKRLLFVPEESPLIQSLQQAYEKVMHEKADVLTKGGASYARVLDHGVAFGATFEQDDPKPHMPNECMPISSLLKACEIYYESLLLLAKAK